MGYASLAQGDAHPQSDRSTPPADLTSDRSLSPVISQLPIAPFSLNFDDLSGNVAVDDNPTTNPTHNDSRVSKILSSLTGSSTSYDLVEADDYEDLQTTETEKPNAMESSVQSGPEPPVRTASVSRQLPLKHPKPDLQSLQGAYVKNVERLEETAQRLSMTSDLGELRKNGIQHGYGERTTSGSSRDSRGMKLHTVSTTSLSNSIVDVKAKQRSSVYSPIAAIASAVDSTSSSRDTQLNLAGKQTINAPQRKSTIPQSPTTDWTMEEGFHVDFDTTSVGQGVAPIPPHQSADKTQERPGSAGSGDTFQQARTLFTDFDGVHYSAANPPRRISISRPPRARDSRAFKQPQPGEEMIYYPAPVPVMLNLPVRLSRMNWTDREKKRLQALSDMPDDMRKAAPWLANEEVVTSPNRQSMARLPPQLRASAFFDHRGTEMNVQLKDGSAVATLDSILDAAAHAPVSAFTDHPIVGHLGKEVYGPAASRKSVQAQKRKPKRKSSMNNLLNTKTSESKLGAERPVPEGHEDDHPDVDKEPKEHDSAPASGAEVEDDEDDEDESESGEDDESEAQYPGGFSKAPTTLLAELQMRKAQQKQRNRTAADVFPNDMHSTLLELDTVTQLQQKARKQKHITLAWEDHAEAERENFDDDDVPLAVLYPEKDRKETANVNRPLGLMQRREIEENEPLSMRRARLRGEPLMPPPVAGTPSNVGEPPRIEEPALEEDAEEPLGQRMKRLRDLKETGSTSDFAREVNSELGLSVADPEPPKTKTPDPEETLGQRRRRLKEEAAKFGSSDSQIPTMKSTASMADLLQRNPVQYMHPNEEETAASAMQTYQQQLHKDPSFIAQQQAAAIMAQGYVQPGISIMAQHPYMSNPYVQQNAYLSPHMQMQMQMQMQMPLAMSNYAMPTTMGRGMMPPTVPYGMAGYANPAGFEMGPPLDAKQRANIDQWRQGIA